MPRRSSKFDSAIVQKKWKNKHSAHINNNRIKQGHYGTLKWLEPFLKYEKKLQKKKNRIWYNDITQKCEQHHQDQAIQSMFHTNDELPAHIDQYQDIPRWNCPLCAYTNTERYLFCCICNHPYSRKPQTIAISHYIKYPKKYSKNTIKTKTNHKLTPVCIQEIISAKTGIPHNKIHVNPLLNKHAMSRLLRKYQRHRHDISLIYTRNEIIPDDNNERFFDGWRCIYCKIYVFCVQCFLEPPQQIIKTPNPKRKNLFLEQMALDDLIVDFCGLKALVYGYCEMYTHRRVHTDIIHLIDAYYRSYMKSAIGHAILPFNQHDLWECNEFSVYCEKRNMKLNCYPLEQLAEHIGYENRRCKRARDLYICLLLMRSDNEWPKMTTLRHVLPIYKVKFRKGVLCNSHNFCDTQDSIAYWNE